MFILTEGIDILIYGRYNGEKRGASAAIDRKGGVVMNNGSVRYDRIPFSDELFPIVINSHSRLSESTSPPPQYSWHEQLEVIYVTEGRVICECDFTRYECNEGDIVIINPCEPHVIRYFDRPAHYLCLMVDPKLYSGHGDISGEKYIQPMSDRKVRFHNVINGNPKAKEILIELFEEYRAANTAYEMAVKGHLLCFLSELFRNEIDRESSKHAPTPNASVSPALRYISEHFSEDIDLDKLSGICCMNRSYFCRRFKKITGRTPVTYVNEYRLAKARALLTSQDRSVSEIAAECGFLDSNYFSRLFTKCYGISPTKFKRSNSEQ